MPITLRRVRTSYRFGSSLVALTLAAAACGGSEVVERPNITATPTTVAPTTEPTVPATEAPTATAVNDAAQGDADAVEGDADPEDVADPDPGEADDEAATDAEGDEPALTEAPAEEPSDALLEIAIVQIVGLGYTDEEAACVAGNLDFNDPRVLSIDPEVIVPAFEDCDADPEAFLELAPD